MTGLNSHDDRPPTEQAVACAVAVASGLPAAGAPVELARMDMTDIRMAWRVRAACALCLCGFHNDPVRAALGLSHVQIPENPETMTDPLATEAVYEIEAALRAGGHVYRKAVA